MKTKLRPAGTNFPGLVAVAGLALLALSARAQDSQLEIDVRTGVVDKSIMWDGRAPAPGAGGHSKIYGILSVQEVKSVMKLVKPVDEKAIMELLGRELERNGFQRYAPGTKPDIVITVSYGRAELANPYIKGVGEQGGNGTVGAATAGGNANSAGNALSGNTGGQSGPGSNDSGATSVTITGGFATQLMDEKTPGFEAKLQKAAGEKLYIRVVAWSYPDGPDAEMLWKTTMVVDDPDHRDLNTIAAKMLEAGAPFFDKEIKDREAEIYKPLPDGRVIVGTPEVVPAGAKK